MTAPLRAKIRIAVKNLEALLQEDNTFQWEEDASKTATHNLNLLEAVSDRASVRLKQVELQINKAYQAIENYTGEIMNLTAAKKAQESATFEKFMTDFRVESTMEEASKISSQLQDKIVNWKFTARKKAYQPEAAAKPTISYSPAVRLPLLQLINFSGVRAEWQEFWEIFRVAVHENQQLSAAEKFLYLRSLLKKEAKDYIAGLSTEAANYSLAVKLLNSKYDNKEERTRELHLQLLERRPCKCLNDCQKLVIFLAKTVRQLKILEQEVEIPAVWLVLEQNLTHNGLPRKFLRAILEKRASDPEWNTSKFLEEFELLVKKEERLQSICNSSGAKTVYEASSDEECSDNDSESEYSESEQSEEELEGAELSCHSKSEELKKSALKVDTAGSGDSPDEEDKVCSSSAPISEIKSSQREYHDEEIGDSTSMWAHCKNSAGDLKESEYSPDEEEYLDSSSESENESSSKECSEAEENQENSTTTWAYRAITTDEGQNPQQTLKTEEQQNRYGYCTNLFASPAKLDAEEDLSDNKCTQKEEIKSYRKTTFRVTTVEEKPTKRQRHQKEKHPEDRMSGAEKSRNKDETIYTSAALVFQEEKAQKSTTTAKRCRKVQRQSRVRRAASFRCSQKKVQNIDSLTKPRQKAVAKPRPRSRTICCNHRWTKKVRKKKKAIAKSCPKVKLKYGKTCNRTRKASLSQKHKRVSVKKLEAQLLENKVAVDTRLLRVVKIIGNLLALIATSPVQSSWTAWSWLEAVPWWLMFIRLLLANWKLICKSISGHRVLCALETVKCPKSTAKKSKINQEKEQPKMKTSPIKQQPKRMQRTGLHRKKKHKGMPRRAQSLRGVLRLRRKEFTRAVPIPPASRKFPFIGLQGKIKTYLFVVCTAWVSASLVYSL